MIPSGKVKKWATEWEKIFAYYTCNKEFVSRIYKELEQLNTKETNNPI